ncbi:TlpA family protein disulfide reductase [Poseidonibacter lekithochrous]|uniref:TlpA family protein disulfide reductase n=1 Tax=Poseidonibacter lekithochrous TaxID=1904463 RepID=UPI0008FCB7BC|nr:TlpA disulfide reductase family protein [Poseidonibacter lekithochrous]QKJ22726.1 protein disulfide reductase, TlpA family [Poseidonibacter lekithochrous]
MKKVILVFLLLVVTSNVTFAYEVGDKIDDSVATKIGSVTGKVTIVDFFASWCASCEKELPLINKINAEKLDNVQIIGIDTDEEVSEGIAFQERLKVNFKVINDDKHILVNKFSPYGMPALYYIKDNKVQKIIFGAIDDIDKVIKKDLKGM